jgi:adenylate cyclase
MASIGFLATETSEDLDLRFSDIVMRMRPRESPPPGVVVVAIDEASYRELQLPFGPAWPRHLHAKLLEQLKTLGAKRVAFDVLFVGAGPKPESDKALAEALGKVPSVLAVESTVRHISDQGGGYTLEEIERPYEPFRKVATEALIGQRDDRGVIRSFPVARSEQEASYPFMYQAAASSDPTNSNAAARGPGPRDLIRYYGPGRTIPIISYWEVLQGNLPGLEQKIKNSIVFVGLLLRSGTGGAQKDSYYSPFEGPMVYGVEVHATLTANLLTNRWIWRPPRALELAAQGLLIAGVTFSSLALSPLVVALVVLACIASWLTWAFVALGIGVFPSGAVCLLIALPLIVVCSSVYAYVVARKAGDNLRSAFSLYVSPDMVPKLLAEGDALKLGGEKLWLTAMFTDIADFTSITEEMPAEKTSEMLNAYFTEVMDVIFNNQGTLIKFIGDAVFAIWGAPVRVPNHSALAIQTAAAIQREVDRFNGTGRYPKLATRIGIHTGPMLVGNLGSKKRFDYTAIGDSVNLASRIEGLNKYLGTDILLTEATLRDAGGFSQAVEVATVRVKGRSESVKLFSLFEPPLSSSILEQWKGALSDFSAARFSQARERFAAVAKQEARLVVASALYSDECDNFIGKTVEQGWNGALRFDAK